MASCLALTLAALKAATRDVPKAASMVTSTAVMMEAWWVALMVRMMVVQTVVSMVVT